MFDRHVPEMDAPALVGALRDCAWDELVAQNLQLVLAAQWAVVHAPESLPRAGSGRAALLGERSMQLGGPGTPRVAEFAAAELAPEIGLSVYQTQSLIADAQDLQHRYPRIWRELRRGRVRAFVVRQIARRTRDLPLEVAKRIDQILVNKIINLPPKRVEHLVDAAILKADPERVRRLVEEAKRARLVEFSQSTEYGIRGLYARLDAPDAARLKATIARLTDILMNAPEPIPGVRYRDAVTRAEWESIALNTLGNPALAFRILVEHDQPELFTAVTDLFIPGKHDPVNEQAPFDVDAEPPADDDLEPPDPETLPPDDLDDLVEDRSDIPVATHDVAVDPCADNSVETPDRDPEREAARDAALRALVKAIDPARLFAPATLYVHLTDAALAGTAGSGGDAPVARVEQVGPALLEQVREWLGNGSTVRVVPVVDPAAMPPVDAYEFPDRMREALWLRTPASVFPYSANTSRGMDLNHTNPYRTGGTGQTGLHNAGPLGRAEHRFVTHGRISVRQPGPGCYVFRTMFGRVLITNPTGTFDLGAGEWADAVWRLANRSAMITAA